MDKKFRILILIKGLGLGGAERLIIDSLPYLDQTNFDYHFAYLLPWKGFLVSQIKAMGFPVYCLGQTRINDDPPTSNGQSVTEPKSLLAVGLLPVTLHHLFQLHQREQFDLIQADLPLAGLLARLVGRWQHIPVVYTEHNLLERYHPLTRWLNNLTYSWNEQVFAVSQEVCSSITHAGLADKTSITTLFNGVPVEQVQAEAGNLAELRAELNIPTDQLVVGTAAVFRTQKRLTDWLEVAKQVSRQREDVTFLLVGDGPERDKIQTKIQQLGLQDRICLPGFRPDGRRLMGLMDVYLISSQFEGLPIALLEAMALGKPVVSTTVGGIPELVTPGQEGFLTKVGAVANLAQYTLQLLADEKLRQRMGKSAAEKIETQYHSKKRVEFIEKSYLQILTEADKDEP